MNKPALERILACPDLPKLSPSVDQLLGFAREEVVHADRVIAVLSRDERLAERLLQLVNAMLDGSHRPFTTARQLTSHIGLTTLRSLVVMLDLAARLQPKGENDLLDLSAFWWRSLHAASAARLLASHAGLVNEHDAFLGGLLQDIGMVAMTRALREKYLEAIAPAGADHRKAPALERATLELDHAEVGSLLARQWKMPDHICEAIRYHHDSSEAEGGYRRLAQAIELGGLLSVAQALPKPEGAIAAFKSRAQEQFSLRDVEVRALIIRTSRNGAELAAALQLKLRDPSSAATRQIETEERLLSRQIELAQETKNGAGQAPSWQALTDPLTGLASRKHFDLDLAKYFDRAVRASGRFAVVVCDIDEFDRINRDQGHQAGDYVLAQLARLIDQHLGSVGFAARYGGEELALILPENDRVEATRVAEDLRRAIEEHLIDLAEVEGMGGKVTLTVSVGVVAYDGSSRNVLVRPELILRAAEQAVDAAKRAGRNCVRVFAPAPVAQAA